MCLEVLVGQAHCQQQRLRLGFSSAQCSPLLFTWHPIHSQDTIHLLWIDKCRELELLSLHHQLSIRIRLAVSPESRLVLIQMYFFFAAFNIHLKHHLHIYICYHVFPEFQLCCLFVSGLGILCQKRKSSQKKGKKDTFKNFSQYLWVFWRR